MPQWFVVNNNPCRHFVWKFSKSLYISVRIVLLQKQSTVLLQKHNLLLTIFGSKYGPKKKYLPTSKHDFKMYFSKRSPDFDCKHTLFLSAEKENQTWSYEFDPSLNFSLK